MKSVGISKTGLVRQANEDRFYKGEKLYIVADGMGGYQGGAIASQLAIENIVSELKDKSSINEELIEKAILTANRIIWQKMKSDEALAGMGTTVVVAAVEGNTLHWGNVGDSRLYIYGDNQLIQLTKDHSLVQSLVDSGKCPEEERKSYPKRNYLMRAVGVDPALDVDTGNVQIKSGDIILLCSDGLSAYLSDEKILEILSAPIEETEKIERLVSAVYELGARDNVTIIIGVIE